MIDGKSEKPTRTPIQTLVAKDFEHDELFASLQRWQVLVLAVVLAVLASVDVEVVVVVVVVVVVTFFLVCCYCSCCYGCCCFLIQMMMLRFIHSPVQTSATDPCPVSKVLRGQATYQPSAMSTNSNCSIIEQMAVPGCMHFFLPESDITFRSWLEHPPHEIKKNLAIK